LRETLRTGLVEKITRPGSNDAHWLGGLPRRALPVGCRRDGSRGMSSQQTAGGAPDAAASPTVIVFDAPARAARAGGRAADRAAGTDTRRHDRPRVARRFEPQLAGAAGLLRFQH